MPDRVTRCVAARTPTPAATASVIAAANRGSASPKGLTEIASARVTRNTIQGSYPFLIASMSSRT